MLAWLWPGWAQLYPNLLADVIYATPAFVVHHVLIRRHITNEHEKSRRGSS